LYILLAIGNHDPELSLEPQGEEMRVIYFGRDEFAVPTLIKLVNSDHKVLGVVTRPSKGTSKASVPANPVAIEAEKWDLPVFVYDETAASNVLKEIQHLKSELGIAADFGNEVPLSLRRIFPIGCVGIHPSLLPKYRGPSPISQAILNGERKTGVTVFRMTDQPYAGPVLVQRETLILPDEIWIELHFRLARIACDAIDASLKILDEDLHYAGVPQDESEASWTTEPKESDGYLRFDEPAEVIALRCRAMWPRPGTLCRYISEKGEVEHLQVVRAKAEQGSLQLSPGTITPDFKVATAEGLLQIQEVKPAKGRVMDWQDFIIERQVSAGERLETIPT
jgi:methionyl-tRNA formyltransferase